MAGSGLFSSHMLNLLAGNNIHVNAKLIRVSETKGNCGIGVGPGEDGFQPEKEVWLSVSGKAVKAAMRSSSQAARDSKTSLLQDRLPDRPSFVLGSMKRCDFQGCNIGSSVAIED